MCVVRCALLSFVVVRCCCALVGVVCWLLTWISWMALFVVRCLLFVVVWCYRCLLVLCVNVVYCSWCVC